MAQSSKTKTQAAELIHRSELARARLSISHAALKHKLGVPTRIKESFLSQPAKWMSGSLLAGLAANFIFRPKKRKAAQQQVEEKVKKERGLIIGLFALCFSLLKPMAKIYATKMLKNYLSNRFEQGSIQAKGSHIDSIPHA